jgi:hypothetical protein
MEESDVGSTDTISRRDSVRLHDLSLCRVRGCFGRRLLVLRSANSPVLLRACTYLFTVRSGCVYLLIPFCAEQGIDVDQLERLVIATMTLIPLPGDSPTSLRLMTRCHLAYLMEVCD